MRILLIEDDKELSENLKGSLIHAGYETDCCYNGIDALYYAKLPAYDLIILDRMLPGLDGLSILRSLRENQIHTPVILATAIDAPQSSPAIRSETASMAVARITGVWI